MGLKQIIGTMLLVPFATAGIGMRSAWAQVASPPASSASVISLETAGESAGGAMPSPWRPSVAPASGTRQGPTVAPSAQGYDYRGLGGNPALGQLANPFDGGSRPRRCGPNVPAAGPIGGPPPVFASEQRPDHHHGKRALRQLRNPYDGGYVQQPAGLWGLASPQFAATPQAPGAMPGAAAPAPFGMPGGAGAGAMAIAGVPGAMAGAGAAPSEPGLPSPTTPGAAAPGAAAPGAAPTAPGAADTFGAAATTTGAGFGGGLEAGATPFAMIGDLSPVMPRLLLGHTNAAPPIPSPIPPPGPPLPPPTRGAGGPGAGAAGPVYSSIRTFKLSENMSPRPQDRIFFNFNYYNGVNNTINLKDHSPITQMKAYIYSFGLEKTFHDGMGSVGLRLPLDNLTANSFHNVVSTPTTTALGNLTVFAKYILAQNRQTGSLITACFAVTPDTGTSRFAGAPYLRPLNTTYLQPCLAYIYNYNRWYLQGFTGFNFPAFQGDVSLMYNDVGIGYFLVRNPDPHAFLTALAPVFELHVNTPINHRDWFNRFDIAGTQDVVDLTYGINFGFRNSAVLTAAFVTPVSSPKPFDTEAVLMLNIFFGRTRANFIQQTPPPAL